MTRDEPFPELQSPSAELTPMTLSVVPGDRLERLECSSKPPMTAAEIRHIFAYRWLEPFQASATESAHAAAAILWSAFSVSHWPAFRREVPVHSLYPGPFSRRRFLHGITLAGTAGLLGWHPRRAAAEPPPETTRIRLVRIPSICQAPQYVAEELLRSEGFTEVHYLQKRGTAEIATALASGEADLNNHFAGPLFSAWRAEDIRLLLRQANARADAGDYRQPRPATGARIARPGYAPMPQMKSGSIPAFGTSSVFP